MFIDELGGPDVVVVDDTDREVDSLLKTLREKGINAEYIKVDIAGEMPDHSVIQSIKLLFLDLNYNNGFGSLFDAHFCAEIVKQIVPKDKQYFLVTWSKDIDKTEEVIDILKELNIAPVRYTAKLKEEYRTGNDSYNVDKLLEELNQEFNRAITSVEFYGEVIEIDDNSVLISCLVDQEHGIYQMRKFDIAPFSDYINLRVGGIIMIRATTKPGSRTFEFFNESDDLRYLFEKPNYFEGLDNTMFFTEK